MHKNTPNTEKDKETIHNRQKDTQTDRKTGSQTRKAQYQWADRKINKTRQTHTQENGHNPREQFSTHKPHLASNLVVETGLKV